MSVLPHPFPSRRGSTSRMLKCLSSVTTPQMIGEGRIELMGGGALCIKFGSSQQVFRMQKIGS